jgi:hypothetical protein
MIQVTVTQETDESIPRGMMMAKVSIKIKLMATTKGENMTKGVSIRGMMTLMARDVLIGGNHCSTEIFE